MSGTLTARDRQALREAIDARRRAAVATDRCGDTATASSYNRGCRCQDCKAAEAAYRTRRRRARAPVVNTHNRNGTEAHRDYDREYRRRQRARRKQAA